MKRHDIKFINIFSRYTPYIFVSIRVKALPPTHRAPGTITSPPYASLPRHCSSLATVVDNDLSGLLIPLSVFNTDYTDLFGITRIKDCFSISILHTFGVLQCYYKNDLNRFSQIAILFAHPHASSMQSNIGRFRIKPLPAKAKILKPSMEI